MAELQPTFFDIAVVEHGVKAACDSLWQRPCQSKHDYRGPPALRLRKSIFRLSQSQTVGW